MSIIIIDSLTAYDMLKNNKDNYLIDIRTPSEWKEGVPETNNFMCISWREGENFTINPLFYQQIQSLISSQNNSNYKLMLLCRGGHRSSEAANFLNQNNISCYNIIDGFEGSAYGKGWKNNNLPWHIL